MISQLLNLMVSVVDCVIVHMYLFSCRKTIFPKSLGSVASYVLFSFELLPQVFNPDNSVPFLQGLCHYPSLKTWVLLTLWTPLALHIPIYTPGFNYDLQVYNSQTCLPIPDFSPKLQLLNFQIPTGITNSICPKLSVCCL